MRTTARKFLRAIGPYPYNSRIIFLVLLVFYFSRFLPLVANKPPGPERIISYGIILFASALPAGIYGIGTALLKRYRTWSSTSLLFFIIELMVLEVLIFSVLPFSQHILEANFPNATDLILPKNLALYISSLFFAIFAYSLSHHSERYIDERLRKADSLVRKLELDLQELVLSDEELRRQTSQFLHDRVQSDLMVAAMNLKSVQGQSSAQVEEAIEKSISILESTRSTDLRNLVQVLTPNFAGGGLVAAIEILERQFGSNFDILVKLPTEQISLSESQLLGVFRIIEQSLLNSLVHGPAKVVRIEVFENPIGLITLSVADDGPGAEMSNAKSGVGSAIIESWVSILKGSFEITTATNLGYKIVVKFPNQSGDVPGGE